MMFAGCAVGPDFKHPAAPDVKALSSQPLAATTASAPVFAGEQQHFNPAADIPFEWWELFQSPQLNKLIRRALVANSDIASAEAALGQAQAYANAQHGFFYPTVGLSYSPSRNKIAGNMGSAAPGPQGNGSVIQAPPAKPTYYDFHVAQLTVGYVPDVFGLNRRQQESADALVSVQQLQLEATYVTLATNVFAAALQEAALTAQITTTEKIISLYKEQLAILHQQNKLGGISGMDVALQESALAQVQQNLIPLQNQLQQARNLVRALTGQFPGEDAPDTLDISTFHLPQEIPQSVPSKLIEQRPDIRAAEAQLHFASAEAGVAIANTLPQFQITGAVGGMADSPGWMLKSGGSFFNLAASVSQVLFDGGTARAKSKAAEQALLQAGAQYRSTVITALENVANTLYTVQSDAEALKAAAITVDAAEKALKITKQQYQLGAIGYQVQLSADQAYQNALINLTQAQANRFADTAALFHALGGGWWNRKNQSVASQQAVTSDVNGGAHIAAQSSVQ